MSYSSYYPGPASNPRQKYLAALEAAKAAEQEFIAAERLQQEEDNLRQRLEHIQLLKHRNASHYAPVYPQQSTFGLDFGRNDLDTYRRPQSFGNEFDYHHRRPQYDLDSLRRQIAAEERARFAQEQAELDVLRLARELQAQRDLAAQRDAAACAQAARAQAARREQLAAASRPRHSVQFVLNDDEVAPRRHHRRSHCCSGREEPAVNAHEVLQNLFSEKNTAPTVDLTDLFTKVLTEAAKPQAKPETTVVPFEQLLANILGAAAPKAPEAKHAPVAGPSKAAPAPAPAPAPQPTSAPSPAKPATQQVGLEQILTNVLGALGGQQNDLSPLMNMFLAGQRPQAPQASSSKSTETKLKEDLEARLRSEASKEDQDLAEAIRMSLADLESSNDKGKAPAPAPVSDLAASVAEVKAVDSAFTALANEFTFPTDLEFSTSRTSSPVRGVSSTEPESVLAKLTYSARNQSVRYYHQALSGLLVRLDAVESHGDDDLRKSRKDVVGRVEGALEEIETVVESRWRKFVGKEERVEEPAPVEVPAEAPAADEMPALDATLDPPTDVPAPDVPVVDPPTASVPEDDTASSYPPSVSESVATLQPYDAAPVDTFLLPATSETETEVKKPTAKEEDVASDWSEVDA